jgi:hypothetical protein
MTRKRSEQVLVAALVDAVLQKDSAGLHIGAEIRHSKVIRRANAECLVRVCGAPTGQSATRTELIDAGVNT